MAFQLQRIIEDQRSSLIPYQGQLVFATDSKRLYVGDGETVGGIGVGVRYLTTDSGGVSSVQVSNVAGNLIANGTYTNLVFSYNEGTQQLSGYADVSEFTGTAESFTLEKIAYVSTDSARLSFVKLRGIPSDPGDIISGDVLGNISFSGRVTNVTEAGSIQLISRGTLSSGVIPSSMRLIVADDNGSPSEMLRLDTNNGYMVLQTSQALAQGITYKNAQSGNQAGRVVFARSRGTHLVPTDVATNDRILDIVFAAYAEGAFRGTALIGSKVRSVFGNIVRAAVTFQTAGADGTVSEVITIEPSGELRTNSISNHSTTTNLTITTQNTSTLVAVGRPMTTSGYLKLPVYASDAERDAAIASPEEGMIIFNRGELGGSQTPQYQGYTTSSGWVSLV